MVRDYIANMYRKGQDTEARRAIEAEIIRENTAEDEEPTYEPTASEIDTVKSEYYVARRQYQYGTQAEQIEYITEHGLSAWQDHIAQIKTDIPKPQ